MIRNQMLNYAPYEFTKVLSVDKKSILITNQHPTIVLSKHWHNYFCFFEIVRFVIVNLVNVVTRTIVNCMKRK